MKRDDKKKLAGLSIEALDKKALEIKKLIQAATLARQNGTVKNSREVRTLKKQLAVVYTIRKGKSL